MKGNQETDNQSICKYCGRFARNTFSNNSHQVLCKFNPNRIKSYMEEWTDEKRSKHSAIMKVKNTNANRIYTEIERDKRRTRKIKHNAEYWTLDNKQAHSQKMREIVSQHPESYSSQNICGRTKGISFVDSYNNQVILNGKWELCVAEYLNDNGIKWTKKINAFPYFWENNWHLYFPDFLLPDLDLYIEVKGFERERDRCKWNHFPQKLIILKQKEIKEIRNNVFTLESV